MKTVAGLWIDHRKAVIVILAAGNQQMRVIESHVESQPRRSGGERSTAPYESQRVPADDSRERQLTHELNAYYDEVIASLGVADSILIFGPGEAKGELHKRIVEGRRAGSIAALETADRMTDRQIAAKVREHFRE